MLICPKCRNEYRDGIKVCADCGCELVAEVKEVKTELLIYGNEEQLGPLESYLKFSGLKGTQIKVDDNDEQKRLGLFVQSKDMERALKMTSVYMQQEQLKAMEAQKAEMEEKARIQEASSLRWVGQAASTPKEPANDAKPQMKAPAAPPTTYMNKKEKAADNKSAAISLIIVGIGGLIFLALTIFDLLPFGFQGGNKYIVGIIMGAMFLGFLIMGFVSLKNSKKYQEEAKKEDDLSSQMKNWVKENLDVKKMDERLGLDTISEEEWYFRRTELLKMILNHEFMNLEQDYLDHFVDDIYDEVFSK